jgi:peroxiredoxin/Cu/Ag efflux protein CusF
MSYHRTPDKSPTAGRPLPRAAGQWFADRRRRPHRAGPILRVVACAMLGLVATGTVGAEPRFEGTGRVAAIDPAKPAVMLDHGAIPGLMGAMRMEFPVEARELLRGIEVGAVVRFSLAPRGAEWVVASMVPEPAPPATVLAPDFTLPALRGDPVKLSGLRGKAVLLSFWATWCVPCRTEMPTIEKLYQGYHAQGLEVVAVNLDVLSTTGVETFVKEVGVTFRVALDPSWSTTRAFGVTGLPTSYLIDRTGHVVAREVGERNWADEMSRTAVERLLR